MKDGKVITEPVVKKGKQVYFHLVEFNNYIYKARMKATQTAAPYTAQSSNNSLVRGLLSGLVSGFLPGVGLPLLNSPLFGNLLGTMPEVPVTGARGGNDDLVAFEAKLKELEAAKEEINMISVEINKRKKSLIALNTTYEFTNRISKDKNIAPSLIKDLLMKHCSDIFLKSADENIILEDVAILNSKLTEIPALENKLKDKISSYDNKLKELKKQREKLQQMDLGNDSWYSIMRQLALSESQLESAAQNISAAVDKQAMQDSKMQRPDYTALIQQFYLKYHEIKENNFSYTHHTTSEQKYLIYEMDLFSLDSASLYQDGERSPIKHVEVKVKSYGGVQLGMSIGLDGSKFTETPQSFYIRNDLIYATNQDQYVPFITSKFNLSYDYGKYVSPALSFGIGLPLSKNESVDNFALFAGPGIYLGKKQSFMISIGGMFSRVTALASGFQVGDKINFTEGSIPTTKKFSFGYYFGISYSLTQL
jgi:hypothetical protein